MLTSISVGVVGGLILEVIGLVSKGSTVLSAARMAARLLAGHRSPPKGSADAANERAG